MTSTADFNAAVDTLRPALVRYAGRIVGDADAEDIVQTTISKASRALSEFRGQSTLRTWLFQIARNTARDWIRAGNGRRFLTDDRMNEVSATTDAEEASQERQFVQKQMSLCVGEVLRGLPPDYQDVLALSDCEELSNRETAAILGVTVGTVKIRLHRARQKMKDALEKACSFYRDGRNTLCCDKKQMPSKNVYPSSQNSRHQVGRHSDVGNVELMKEEFAMSPHDVLSVKQKHLIGVGASIAAGCHPCTMSYVSAAKAEGACDRGVRASIEKGIEGREGATRATTLFAAAAFASPKIDATFRTGRELQDSLIGVAASVASNASASIEQALKAAREAGATEAHLRIAVQIGRTVRQGAERETEACIAAAFGERPASRCCEGGSEITREAPDASNPPSGACGCPK